MVSSTTTLSPFVYWAQEKDVIHLKIELRNAEVSLFYLNFITG